MSGRRRGGGGEMGGGVGVARNKRGTPMYSREDIREQYCINDKELHALEASRRKPIFGCLTSSNTQPSPCKKKSLLPACLRGRVPSDENVYSKSQSAHTSPAHRKGQETIDYEDDNYFRRRPKTICYTDPRRLAALDDSLAKSGRVPRPRSDAGNASYESYLNEDGGGDAGRRPTQLAITSGEYHSTEIYQDDADHREGYTIRRTAFTQPNTPDLGHSTRFHQVTTPEVFLDDRPQKHVSFQKAMSRSATVGGLEDHGGMTRDDSGRGSVRSGGSRSQERLLDGRRTPDYMEQRALDQLLAPVLTKALLQEPGHKKNRKHGDEGKRKPGGLQVSSEAGSRSSSRSRTPSLRRKKPEKKTIGIQTDELPCDLEIPEDQGAQCLVDTQRSKETEFPEGDKKSAKRQKKSKKKLVEEAPIETPQKKETVHFVDQTEENVHAKKSAEVGAKAVKKPKKKSESSKSMPEKESSHSKSDDINRVSVKTSSKHVKDSNRKLRDAEIQQDTKHEPRPPDSKKVSMGMQTDSVGPLLSHSSIFMTEDLDTSTDWHGEESSFDWRTSAGSLAWHTDASSFAWHTDASSYCRQTDVSSPSCRADNSSFAPESCEEMVEDESEEEENILNMDIDLIREKGIKDNPLDKLEDDLEENEEKIKYSSSTEAGDHQSRKVFDRLPEKLDDSIPEEEQVFENDSKEIEDKPDRDTEVMVRRLRFRRQLAEDFLLQNSQKKGPFREVPKEQVLEKGTGAELESNPVSVADKPRVPTDARKENLASTSTFPKKSKKSGDANKDTLGKQEAVETRTEMLPLETSRTWPKSLVETERSDDIDLKSFQAFSDAQTSISRKRKDEKPSHKTSWLEINLVKKEVERAETPRCVQISNSQLNKITENEVSNVTIDRKAKLEKQQVDISDEYPRSDHDYNTKKSSPRSEGSRSLQRRKKTVQKDSSDSSTSHPLNAKSQDVKKVKSLTKIPLDKVRENLPLESPRMSSSTDTSSAMPAIDPAGKRIKKSKKPSVSSQMKGETTGQDSSTNSHNAPLKEVIEEDAEPKEVPLDENLSSAENKASSVGTSSLRRKRSIKRRKSICIQTEFSYDEPVEGNSENVDLSSSEAKDVSERDSVKPDSKRDATETVNPVESSKAHHEPESLVGNKDRVHDSKSETVSIVTTTGSIRRIKKVRKTTTSTQTEEIAFDECVDDFLQKDSQVDSVSVRTSSLRRIRKAEKKSVEIQTEMTLPICADNLHMSILDFEEVSNVCLSSAPGHSDSLIYVNIPAAFLEIGESGNDADISDADSDDEDSKKVSEKIYKKLSDVRIEGFEEKEGSSFDHQNLNGDDDMINDQDGVMVEGESHQGSGDESGADDKDVDNFPRNSCEEETEQNASDKAPEETSVTDDANSDRDASEDEDIYTEDKTRVDAESDGDRNGDEGLRGNEDESLLKSSLDVDVVDEDLSEKETNNEKKRNLTSEDTLSSSFADETAETETLITTDLDQENTKENDAVIDPVTETNKSSGQDEVYTITAENLLLKQHDEEESSDEDEDFDIYIVEQHHDVDHTEVPQESKLTDLECNESDAIKTDKVDEECQVDIAIQDSKHPGNKKLCDKLVEEEVLPRSTVLSCVEIKIDDSEIHADLAENSTEEPQELDSGVSEEESKDVPDEDTVRVPWYFGAQDKTFEAVEGAEEAKRQDTVIYCPSEGNGDGDNEESQLPDDMQVSEVQAEDEFDHQENERVAVARKQFKESRMPFGKGHFSEGDAYQLPVMDTICLENKTGLAESEVSAEETVNMDIGDTIQFPSPGNCKVNIEDEELLVCGSPEPPADETLISERNKAKHAEECTLDVAEQTNVPALQSDPREVRSPSITNIDDQLQNELEDLSSRERSPDSTRSGDICPSPRYPHDAVSLAIAAEFGDTLSPGIANLEDQGDNELEESSYREKSPGSIRSGSSSFSPRYQHDAVSLAMAAECGYPLSEEEEDEVIVFSYRKVRQTQDKSDRLCRSEENLLQQDGRKDDQNVADVNKKSESRSTEPEISENNLPAVEKESTAEPEKKEEEVSVKPKRRRQKKKPTGSGKGEAESKAEKPENEISEIGTLQKELLPRDETPNETQFQQEQSGKETESAELKKKKKRPRNRKKKNKADASSEFHGEEADEESKVVETKHRIDMRETCQNKEMHDNIENTAKEQRRKHKLWAEEVEENVSNEWRSYVNERSLEDNSASSGACSKVKLDPALATLQDKNDQELQGFQSLKMEEEDTETSFCDDDESSHYEGDSSRYEDESEIGEGGGEQNAYEEYLLIKEGDCQEEMKAVDRVFRDVFKGHSEDLLMDDDILDHMQGAEDLELDSQENQKQFDPPQEASQIAESNLMDDDKSSSSGVPVKIDDCESLSAIQGAESLGKNTEDQIDQSKAKSKVKKTSKRAKKAEDLQPADNLEG